MGFDWGIVLVLLGSSLFTAVTALYVLTRFGTPRLPPIAATDAQGEDTVFLFDEEHLIDATPRAQKLLEGAPTELPEWDKLSALLTPRFPDYLAQLKTVAEHGAVVLDEASGAAQLRIRALGETLRIALIDPQTAEDNAAIDQQSLAALNSELSVLQRVASQVPALAWQLDSSNGVSWANNAYLNLVRETLEDGETLVWPLPHLFKTDGLEPRRLSITLPSGETHWFDCMAGTGGEQPMFFGLPADATVHAEASLRNFVQTLTKTFAHLPTGLAIFNRSRHLVMFNPALIDLCLLEPEFLTARPTLFAFLDRLREKQMIPEPKDYKTWRQKMTALEQDAASGVFEETWTLPSGQTYRVAGRPHPDGAVAFMFEDISSEVSLTRRFRAELEVGQAVFDSLDEAMAVFSSAGVLTMSNNAYAELWGSDPCLTLGEVGIHDSVQLWQQKFGPAPAWSHMQDFITGRQLRQRWRTDLTLPNGETLTCQLTPIAGGATLAAFSMAQPNPGLSPSSTLAVSGATL